MNIDETRELRAKLEVAISVMIWDFEKTVGVRVSKLRIVKLTTQGDLFDCTKDSPNKVKATISI